MVAGRPGNIKPSGFQAPPSQGGQQTMNAAGVATPIMGQPTAGTGGAANQASPKIPSTAENIHNSDILLQQTRKLRFSPAKMAISGFAFVATVACFTTFSNNKPEACALDVARTENTRPPRT